MKSCSLIATYDGARKILSTAERRHHFCANCFPHSFRVAFRSNHYFLHSSSLLDTQTTRSHPIVSSDWAESDNNWHWQVFFFSSPQTDLEDDNNMPRRRRHTASESRTRRWIIPLRFDLGSKTERGKKSWGLYRIVCLASTNVPLVFSVCESLSGCRSKVRVPPLSFSIEIRLIVPPSPFLLRAIIFIFYFSH